MLVGAWRLGGPVLVSFGGQEIDWIVDSGFSGEFGLDGISHNVDYAKFSLSCVRDGRTVLRTLSTFSSSPRIKNTFATILADSIHNSHAAKIGSAIHISCGAMLTFIPSSVSLISLVHASGPPWLKPLKSLNSVL